MKIEKNNYIWPVVKEKILLNQIISFDNQVKEFKISKNYKRLDSFLNVLLIGLTTFLLILITVFLVGSI